MQQIKTQRAQHSTHCVRTRQWATPLRIYCDVFSRFREGPAPPWQRQRCEVFFVEKTLHEMQHGLGLRVRFNPNGTAVDSHWREPVVHDQTTAEVPNGTTGIAIGMSHVVLSGLKMTSKASGRWKFTCSYRRQTVDEQHFHRLATVATGIFISAARLTPVFFVGAANSEPVTGLRHKI